MILKDKICIITGASSGLGRAAALELAREGVRVVALARSRDKLITLQSEITDAGGKVHIFSVDLSKSAMLEKTAQQILKTVGTPDIIINNAGAGVWKETEATTHAENLEMMNLPYLAAFNLTRVCLPAMLKANNGYIANVTSPASNFPIPGAVAYSVARWAMRGFTMALRADLYSTNIKTGLFVAGKIDSDYFRNNPGSEERIPRINRLIPALSTQQAAQILVRMIKRRKKYVITPFMMQLFYVLRVFFPTVVDFFAMSTGWRRK